jgi:hypothetical protein
MSDPDQTNETPPTSILTKLTTRMSEALTKASTPTHMKDSVAASIGIKLDGSNYALWSQVVEMYISCKDKLGYINGDIHQPPQTDPSFRKWRTDNAIVKGWLINSMDPSLIGNFIRFPTEKMVWDSIARHTLTGVIPPKYMISGDVLPPWSKQEAHWRSSSANYRASSVKLISAAQTRWSVVDIQHYNTMIQEERVCIFLDGLDDRLDNIRGDIL